MRSKINSFYGECNTAYLHLGLGEDVKRYLPLTAETCAQRCHEPSDRHCQDLQSENTFHSFQQYSLLMFTKFTQTAHVILHWYRNIKHLSVCYQQSIAQAHPLKWTHSLFWYFFLLKHDFFYLDTLNTAIWQNAYQVFSTMLLKHSTTVFSNNFLKYFFSTTVIHLQE